MATRKTPAPNPPARRRAPKVATPAPPAVPIEVDEALLARARHSHLGVPVLRLLRVLEVVLEPGRPHAIGGGVALGPAGYPRMTVGVDLLLPPTDARKLSIALARTGLVVEGVRGVRRIAYFTDDNQEWLSQGEAPEFRINLLAAITEPETTAIRTAVRGGLPGGWAFSFVQPDVLAALMFLANRPEDLVDFDKLIEAGRVDIGKARDLIAINGGDDAALRFDVRVHRRRTTIPNGPYAGRGELKALFATRPRM